MIIVQNPPPLGLAHFTVLEVPPLDLVSRRQGSATHPWAFGCTRLPRGPYYTIPVGSSAMREMKGAPAR